MATVIKMIDGGDETFFRCDLSQASAPLQYWSRDGWASTQYQCADCRHRVSEMIELCRSIIIEFSQVPADEQDDYFVDHEVVETFGFRVSDGNQTENCETFAEAVDRISEWYADSDSWSTGEGDDEMHAAIREAIDSVDQPEDGDCDDLQSYADDICQAIAEACGQRDFAGHGNYSVSAADCAGMQLTVTEIDHP